MGLSYHKSFKAGPVRVTASKSGISYSTGVKGARITKRADRRVQATLSAPGTGLRYTTTTPSGKSKAAGRPKPNGPQAERTPRRRLAIDQLCCHTRHLQERISWPLRAISSWSPCVRLADAWADLACSVRYQKGRRDDRIAAAVTSLYWDRANKTAWAELADLASAAPHVPTLLGLFARVPHAARPPVLTKLISVSHGRDRLGNMRTADGERLRAGLAAIAQADGDTATTRKLAADTRKHQGSGG